jgi:hypothetical protein
MVDLLQHEADYLLALEKERVNDDLMAFPAPGDKIAVDLRSVDHKEAFILDIERSRIVLNKAKFQTRAHLMHPIARIDLVGPPHRNPDGQEVICPHLHIYREGYGLRWAFPIDPNVFPTPDDLYATLFDFMQYCNIVEPPNIEAPLF